MGSCVGLRAERYGLTLNYQDEIINSPLKLRFPFNFLQEFGVRSGDQPLPDKLEYPS